MARKRTNDRTRSFVSLFSGCGGLDLGFMQAGFACLGAYDFDPKAVETHTLNLRSPCHLSDLSEDFKLTSSQTPDLVLSGSPCQGFSTIGKRDHNDKRNKLLLRGAQIAVELKAEMYIGENVPAVKFGSHVSYWEELKSFLKENGYACHTLDLNAHDFGVAQFRRRVFLIGVRGSIPATLQPKTTAPAVLRDVIGNLEGSVVDLIQHNPQPLTSPTELAIARHIRPGQKLCNVRAGERSVHTWDIPSVFGSTTVIERQVLRAILGLRRRERRRDFGDADPVAISSIARELGSDVSRPIANLLRKKFIKSIDGDIDFTHTFNGKYRRLQWEQPSATVDTRFGSARSFLHPSKDRALTLREAARIQGFPDDFEFQGSMEGKFRMVGNAVPPPMAKALAVEALSFLRGAS